MNKILIVEDELALKDKIKTIYKIGYMLEVWKDEF